MVEEVHIPITWHPLSVQTLGTISYIIVTPMEELRFTLMVYEVLTLKLIHIITLPQLTLLVDTMVDIGRVIGLI